MARTGTHYRKCKYILRASAPRKSDHIHPFCITFAEKRAQRFASNRVYMEENKEKRLREAWREAVGSQRRKSRSVPIGSVQIGGNNPVAIQTMTDCSTNDIRACVEQIGQIYDAGCRIVRLTTQGLREAESFGAVAGEVRHRWPEVSLVADVHFVPQVADAVADFADKVRINPGNYNDRGGNFEALLEKCRQKGVALRIGVNHGSLSEDMVTRYGDTPEGMAESAMKFLRVCVKNGFSQAVISMKSSNTRVMVHAYRLLVASMYAEGMDFPVHLGVTEAGNGIEGRIKSAVGIGGLMADGIGDTLRVSLTEPPRNEVPVARAIINYFAVRERDTYSSQDFFTYFDPFAYKRRTTEQVGRIGGGAPPLSYGEFDEKERRATRRGETALLTAHSSDPVGEWRKAIAAMERKGDKRPIVLHRAYEDTDPEMLAVKAAADFGVMFIDGAADAIFIESTVGIAQEDTDSIALDILQASRARMSKTEFIACPGCGRTLYALQDTLETVKSRLSHLKGLKIGVMGCIVNGPGEMADADYGYVGAAPGRITLYRGKEAVKRNIPQEEALDALIELIRQDGRWIEPEA